MVSTREPFLKRKGRQLFFLKREVIRKKYAYLFMLPFSIIFFTFVILPVGIAIRYSFTSFDILQPARWVGLDNYRRLFIYDDIFQIAVKNTLLFALITGPISYFLCLIVAWVINDLGPKLRAFLTLLFYAPTLCNIYVVWKIIFSADAYGFLNSWLMKYNFIDAPIGWLLDVKYIKAVVIVVMLWSSFGTGFLTFIAGLQNVDPTLYEAAAMDGVKNRWQEFWYVTLPSMKEQLMFGAVMSITGSFGIGGVITGLVGFPSTSYAAHTIMNHLDDYGGIRYEMGYACAIATVLFVVMIVSNELVQKMLEKIGR